MIDGCALCNPYRVLVTPDKLCTEAVRLQLQQGILNEAEATWKLAQDNENGVGVGIWDSSGIEQLLDRGLVVQEWKEEAAPDDALAWLVWHTVPCNTDTQRPYGYDGGIAGVMRTNKIDPNKHTAALGVLALKVTAETYNQRWDYFVEDTDTTQELRATAAQWPNVQDVLRMMCFTDGAGVDPERNQTFFSQLLHALLSIIMQQNKD